MPALDWEDLGEFLDVDEFATTAQLWRNGVLLRSFPVLFDEPSADAALGDYRHDTTLPTIATSEVNVQGATKGDEIRLGARAFDVMASPEVQGDGWSRLRIAPQMGGGGR